MGFAALNPSYVLESIGIAGPGSPSGSESGPSN